MVVRPVHVVNFQHLKNTMVKIGWFSKLQLLCHLNNPSYYRYDFSVFELLEAILQKR